jgi:hypothetical protein
MIKPLSPAAQAVFSAWAKPVDVDRSLVVSGQALEAQARGALAAALRAAADQVVPEQFEPPAGEGEPWPRDYQLMSDSKWEQRQHIHAQLLAIAAELEAGHA